VPKTAHLCNLSHFKDRKILDLGATKHQKMVFCKSFSLLKHHILGKWYRETGMNHTLFTLNTLRLSPKTHFLSQTHCVWHQKHTFGLKRSAFELFFMLFVPSSLNNSSNTKQK
jgi:hypothetical protein